MASIKNEETYKQDKQEFLEEYRIKLKAISDDAFKNLSVAIKNENFSLEGLTEKKAGYFREIDDCVTVALSKTSQWNDEIEAIAKNEKATIDDNEWNNLIFRIKLLEIRVRLLQESMERMEQQRLIQGDDDRFAKSCLGG